LATGLESDRRINDLIFVDAQDGWMVGTEGF